MARVIFGWLFLVLIYFFINHSLVSQIAEPALIYPGSDNSFWLAHLLNIPQLLTGNHWAALCFDIILTCSCLVCVFVPRQRVFTWITVIGVWALYIVYCSTAGKHYAQIGYLLAPVPFLVLSPNRFELMWELFRYWVCLLYFTAGCYKLYYGGFAGAETMSAIIFESNAFQFAFVESEGVHRYLVEHPALAQWIYRLAALMDLAFIIGFFTKRFDKWLLIGLLTFHIGNFLLLHISFVEQSLIFAAFLPWTRWAKQQISSTNDRPFTV